MEGCLDPIGSGISFFAKYLAIAFSNIAIWQSNIETSINVPLPVFCLSYKAALMPIAVNKPAVISPIDVPTLVGSESGCPVTLIKPPIPCTTIS